MKATFFVTARNKVKYVRRAVESAYAQTYPCHIMLSDQSSTDGTYEVMEEMVKDCPERHKVELVRCPIEGEYGMTAANAHTMWAVERAQTPWIFQCSADDFSLPERVAVCMSKVEELTRAGKECAAIACPMYYMHEEQAFDPKTTPYIQIQEDMYVPAGWGLRSLVYGSTIQGWNRDFFIKAGSAENVTGDVFHGFLAACDKGYYVVNKPMHAKIEYADLANMGFQGKMKAAEKSGDQELMTRINELNRFQLFELYFKVKLRQQKLYPLLFADDQNVVVNMMLEQAVGWYTERASMHKHKWMPGII